MRMRVLAACAAGKTSVILRDHPYGANVLGLRGVAEC
jgi:hypothetical protein